MVGGKTLRADPCPRSSGFQFSCVHRSLYDSFLVVHDKLTNILSSSALHAPASGSDYCRPCIVPCCCMHQNQKFRTKMGGPGILASFLHSCLDWYQDQDGWWLVPELTIPYHFGQDTHKSMLTPLDWLKLQRSNAVKVKKNQRYLLRQCNQIQKAPNQLSAIPVFFF